MVRNIMFLTMSVNLFLAKSYVSAYHFMALFSHCRQVQPLPDNLAANSLPSDIQERNVRKVRISAKVTFAIWVLETTSFAVLFFAQNIYLNYELLSTASILFVHVAIPFTFLANSSENRERLSDVKVIDIIQNTIGICAKNATDSDPTVPTVAYTVGSKSIKEMASEKEVSKWADRLQNPFNGAEVKDPNEHDETVLSTFQGNISNGAAEIFDAASTSRGDITNQTKADMILTRKASVGSDEDDTSNLRGDMHSSVAGEILERMAVNIDVEYRYIFYLKELLRLEELAGDNYDYNLENFKINEFDEVHFSRRQKAKNVQGLINRKHDNDKRVYTDIDDNELKIKFKGNFLQRRDSRKEMLNNFRNQLHEYLSYKQFLNDLLDLDENLREILCMA